MPARESHSYRAPPRDSLWMLTRSGPHPQDQQKALQATRASYTPRLYTSTATRNQIPRASNHSGQTVIERLKTFLYQAYLQLSAYVLIPPQNIVRLGLISFLQSDLQEDVQLLQGHRVRKLPSQDQGYSPPRPVSASATSKVHEANLIPSLTGKQSFSCCCQKRKANSCWTHKATAFKIKNFTSVTKMPITFNVVILGSSLSLLGVF